MLHSSVKICSTFKPSDLPKKHNEQNELLTQILDRNLDPDQLAVSRGPTETI